MKIITIPCSFDNYSYLIICEETGEAAVVDPAEYYPVSQEIQRAGVRLMAVYCTHHHADHVGGLADLRAEFAGLEIYGHESDSRRIPGMNRPLTDGSKIRIGKISGQVLHTPGHTLGGICYLIEDVLFTGDTLFGSGCGRLFEGSPKQMYDVLYNKIKPLPQPTKIYFGHEYTVHNLKFASFVEPDNQAVVSRLQQATQKREKGQLTTPSTLQLECATNPFLRCAEPGIVKTVREKGMEEALDPLSIFTALRRLRDSF